MPAIGDLALVSVCGCAALLAFVACSGGSGGSSDSPEPEPPATSTELDPRDVAPGIVVAITSVSGGSRSNSSFQPGDQITLELSLAHRDGTPWGISEMTVARAFVSGPTFSYQRVIAQQDDVAARAIHLGEGVYRYTIADAIPATYLAPLNDSPAIGAVDGELTGQALLDGTYTVGLSIAWDYTVGTQSFRDAGEAVANFKIGDTAVLQAREVVRQDNCVRCHVELRAHDDVHRDVRVCVLCHTSGAEDLNDPAVEGGTPGVSVDSKVLFHKIHSGKNLPSVLGIAVGDDDGELTYEATPRRYLVAAGDGTVHDYSDVGFPVFPSRESAMPRDFGFNALSPEAKAKDEVSRQGITSCVSCHGDPDGAGPLVEPAQGHIIETQSTRAACGSCHDDVDWDRNYTVNQQTMEPQANNSTCIMCHETFGGPTAVIDGHRHPLLDTIFVPHAPFITAFNEGLNVEVTDVVEAGDQNADGTFDFGEKVLVAFDMRKDSGAPIAASAISGLRVVISGPTSNSNLVLDTEIPLAALSGAPPYVTNVPERRQLELVGHSTASFDTFMTRFAPHWNVSGAATVVRVRVTSGASTTLAASTGAPQNFIDVDDASGFARDDYLVVDDGIAGFEEYARVQFVEGNRLWFSSPRTNAYPSGLRKAHLAGASVALVVLEERTLGVEWSLDAASGTIQELTEFGDGNAVLVDYTNDFVWPDRYPLAHNASPDLDETCGEWTGKSLVSGTYRLGVSGWIDQTFFGPGVKDEYRIVSPPALRDVLVGSASSVEPYALIDSGDACNACHQDLSFHANSARGVERGFEACILCHANAGSEDVPRYVAANAPPTNGVTANFRTLLHQIHMGKDLANEAFQVISASTAAYPDNFEAKSYASFEFAANPGGSAQCAKCHGPSNESWKSPAPRDHPTEQGAPVRTWRAACGACHDSAAAGAHIELETTSAGVEACDVCHGKGAQFEVELAHESR